MAMTGHPRRHFKHIPDGGPGGDGGSVYAEADPGVTNLAGITHRQKAQNGWSGKKHRWQGPSGGNIHIKVPLGTTVRIKRLQGLKLPKRMLYEDRRSSAALEDDGGVAEKNSKLVDDFMSGVLQGEERQDMLTWLEGLEEEVVDLLEPGQSVCVAQGGAGGKGNGFFRHLQPDGPYGQHFELGGRGECCHVILELKTIADIGLVGIPNAGKSSLLRALSRANPKISPEAFTTIRPQLGAVCFPDGAILTVADIPGLIEGAHEDRGLGAAFLRHIERTRALALVVDVSVGVGEHLGPEPWDQVTMLRYELKQYYPELLHKPQVVVANKVDLFDNVDFLQSVLERLQR